MVVWNIGRGIEVIPHMRRPHPALMHTGHGRTIPKIVGGVAVMGVVIWVLIKFLNK